MNLNLEALHTFAQAANLGSFSAAARRLGKRQSTISEAIAKLELDLGVELFIRGPRQLSLTDAGQHLLEHANAVINAADKLHQQASRLAMGQEAQLTLALSDAYQSQQYEARLIELDERYPELKFECVIAEHSDMLELINSGRAHLGLISAQSSYPPDIAHRRIASFGEFGVYVSTSHPLSAQATISQDDLTQYRALRLSTVLNHAPNADDLSSATGALWQAPDYLLLLEMAVMGFGWAVLPRQLVAKYGQGKLHELPLLGWPRQVPVDAIWSRQRPLGPVAAWLLERLIH